MSSCIFFQIIIRPLKIFPWTCILHFSWDELKFYPTFEKKHNNLIFSKLGYSKISSRGYTQRMQNPSPEAIAQSWKKSKFCKFWEIFCFWNYIRGRTNAVSTTPPVIICSKLEKMAARKNFWRIWFPLRKNSSIHKGGKSDRTSQTYFPSDRIYCFLKTFNSFCGKVPWALRLKFCRSLSLNVWRNG